MKLSPKKISTRNEDELLKYCARVAMTPTARDRLQKVLQQQIDWQAVLNRAWWHRIRPLTYRHLSDLPGAKIPAAFLKLLKSHVDELEERNQRLLNMLRYISGLFEQRALKLLVFKGPTLAIDTYGDLKLRECGDLDLLIRQDDFPRVKELLVANGFACLWDQIASGRKRQLFACEFQRDGIELDVHWDLAPHWHNYKVDFDYLWERGPTLDAQRTLARKMRPEDALEILCVHGTRHWWDRLRWICDIAELINSGSITDWRHVATRANEGGGHRSVWLGLQLARDLLDAKLPHEIQEILDQKPVMKRLVAQVTEWIESAEQAAAARKLSDRFLFRMRLCEGWRERIPHLVNYVVTMPSRSLNWNP